MLTKGFSPWHAFRAVIRHIAAHHADVDFIVSTGDLVDQGTDAEPQQQRPAESGVDVTHAAVAGAVMEQAGAEHGRQDGEESEEGSGQLPHAVTYTREPWRQASRKLRCCHEVGSMADVRSLPPPDPSVTASREDGEAPGAPRDGMRLAS